jgi:hypothetical protein
VEGVWRVLFKVPGKVIPPIYPSIPSIPSILSTLSKEKVSILSNREEE